MLQFQLQPQPSLNRRLIPTSPLVATYFLLRWGYLFSSIQAYQRAAQLLPAIFQLLSGPLRHRSRWAPPPRSAATLRPR